MRAITTPVLNDTRGLHLGQLITLKDAAAYARMTKRELLVPYMLSSAQYPLVERMRACLTPNEAYCTRFVDMQGPVSVEILGRASRLSDLMGNPVVLAPPERQMFRLVYGGQFQLDVNHAMAQVQQLNIFASPFQTNIKTDSGACVSQEFLNVIAPILFDHLDTFAFGANILGAWPTKSVKLAIQAGTAKADAYQFFIHPVLVAGGEKLGVWRNTISVENIAGRTGLSEAEQPHFLSLLSLYYTTKSKKKQISVSESDLAEISKVYQKISNVCRWVNLNLGEYFSTPFLEGPEGLDLKKAQMFDFITVTSIVFGASRSIDLFRAGQCSKERLLEEIHKFACVCSLLDWAIVPEKTALYLTGSSIIWRQTSPSGSVDLDVLVLPGRENNVVRFVPPRSEGMRLDFKLINSEDLSYGYNFKLASMFLDSNADRSIKTSIREKIRLLSPDFAKNYLVEGLFEAYLFQTILNKEFGTTHDMVLPVDIIKKSPGLQRTMDYMRWYLFVRHGENILDGKILDVYIHFLKEKQQLADRMVMGDFSAILDYRSRIIDLLDAQAERCKDMGGQNFIAGIRSIIVKNDWTLSDFSGDVRNGGFLSGLDTSGKKLAELKLADDLHTAVDLLYQLREDRFMRTPFMKMEVLKAFLQNLRIRKLQSEKEIALENETVGVLRSISPIYTSAAIDRRLDVPLDDLAFYWNNLTHVSDIYLKGHYGTA